MPLFLLSPLSNIWISWEIGIARVTGERHLWIFIGFHWNLSKFTQPPLTHQQPQPVKAPRSWVRNGQELREWANPSTENQCSTAAIPLKGPPFCSYKTRGLEKNLQNDWVPMIFSPYKMVGPCASTTSFHHPSILYGGILSPDVRFLFFLGMNFACMLWPCTPKTAPFCKNQFLYHYLSTDMGMEHFLPKTFAT